MPRLSRKLRVCKWAGTLARVLIAGQPEIAYAAGRICLDAMAGLCYYPER